MRKWIEQSPVTIGIVLVLAGFLAMFVAWNGAAEKDYVAGQMPYVISGGLAGLALVGAGLCVVVVQSVRRENGELASRLDELIEAVRDLGGPQATAAGPTVVPASGVTVVAGRSTYHLSTCRLAEGRADFQTMSPEAAEERGLKPCRICKPLSASA